MQRGGVLRRWDGAEKHFDLGNGLLRVALKGLPMIRPIPGLKLSASGVARLAAAACAIGLALALGAGACARRTTCAGWSEPDVVQQPATTDAAPAAAAPAPDAASPQEATPAQTVPAPASPAQANDEQQAVQAENKPATGKPKRQKVAEATGPEAPGDVTKEELKQLLVGKDLFLRGGYLGDSISFNEHGGLFGHSPYGSYTLCGVRIDKVHLSKHKLELEGARYGLHFLGAMPYEDPTKAMDRVRITPKKKVLKITIDREMVVKAEEGEGARSRRRKAAKGKRTLEPPASRRRRAGGDERGGGGKGRDCRNAGRREQPADWASVTTTTSPAHAKQMLLTATEQCVCDGAGRAGCWRRCRSSGSSTTRRRQAKTDYTARGPGGDAPEHGGPEGQAADEL